MLGCIAVPFFALLLARRVRAFAQESAMSAALFVFALGFALQFALLMVYFWGKFDDIVIRRLSLPTHLGLVLIILVVLAQFRRPIVARVLLAVAVIDVIVHGVPSMAAHAYNQEYLPGHETAWRRQFIADQPRKDYLMIDNDSILWIAHQISATPTEVLNASPKRRADLAALMRHKAFSGVYVFQRYNIDPETGEMTIRPGDQLDPGYILEPVREARLRLLTLTRISRVKEIREGNLPLTTPDPATATVPKSRAEIEELRRIYLENFVKMLP